MLSHLVTGFISRAAVAVLNLIALLVCSRYLGSEALGTVSLVILNVAIVQAVCDIYTGPALVHAVPAARTGALYLRGLIWMAAVVVVLNFALVYLRAGSPFQLINVFILSFLACLIGFHNNLLLGRERIGAYYFLQFLQPALLVASLSVNVFARGMEGEDPYILALYYAWGATALVSFVLVLRELAVSRGNGGGVPVAAIIGRGTVNQFANLAHILSNRFNYYILGAVSAVGVYTGATSLIESVWVISAGISPLVLSRVANRRDEGREPGVILLLAKCSFTFSFLCVIAVVCIPPSFFTWLLGKDFTGVRGIMLLLAPGVLFISFSGIISHYFSGKGKQRVLLFANSCGLLVTLALSYPLVQAYGMKGAAITASMAYMAQAIFLSVRFMRDTGSDLRAMAGFSAELGMLSSWRTRRRGG